MMIEIFIPRSARASHRAQRRSLQTGAEQTSAPACPRRILLTRKTNLKQASLRILTAEDRSKSTVAYPLVHPSLRVRWDKHGFGPPVVHTRCMRARNAPQRERLRVKTQVALDC